MQQSTPVIQQRTNPEPDSDTLCIIMRLVSCASASSYR
jgi:hypothetical protein